MHPIKDHYLKDVIQGTLLCFFTNFFVVSIACLLIQDHSNESSYRFSYQLSNSSTALALLVLSIAILYGIWISIAHKKIQELSTIKRYVFICSSLLALPFFSLGGALFFGLLTHLAIFMHFSPIGNILLVIIYFISGVVLSQKIAITPITIPYPFSSIFRIGLPLFLTVLFILLILTLVHLWYTYIFKYSQPVGSLSIMGIFLGGLSGITGIWILLLKKEFKNVYVKVITLLLLTFGIITASIVLSTRMLQQLFLNNYSHPLSLYLQIGLLLLIITTIIHSKETILFPSSTSKNLQHPDV